MTLEAVEDLLLESNTLAAEARIRADECSSGNERSRWLLWEESYRKRVRSLAKVRARCARRESQ